MSHKSPKEGATCLSCWEDLTPSTYVEFKSSVDSEWAESRYCEICITELLRSKWPMYVTSLKNVTCKAEQRRLLAKGPPINLADPELPCPDNGEVFLFWFMSDGQEHSAKLEGSLTGEVELQRRIYVFPFYL